MNVWTDERIATLTQLWGEGRTALAIATALGEGVTRNSVIGKARRLNLGDHSHYQKMRKATAKKRASPKIRADRPKRDRSTAAKERTAFGRIIRGKQFKQAPTFTGDVWQPLPGIAPIELVDLNAHTCRWPVGEAPVLYCGDHVAGTVYCETHQQISVRPTKAEAIELELAA